MTYMKKVMPGSILVALALPHCCFPLTFDKDMQRFLKEEDVLGVHVGGLCILDLHQHEVSNICSYNSISIIIIIILLV